MHAILVVRTGRGSKHTTYRTDQNQHYSKIYHLVDQNFYTQSINHNETNHHFVAAA